MESPEPGVYFDVPAETYFSWDAVSNSRLGLMKRSPKHYQHGFNEPTSAMRLGSLVHSGVLEPLQIVRRYCFMPDYSKHPDNMTGNGVRSYSSATTFVKQMQEQFAKLNSDKEIVTEQEFDTMVGMCESLAGNDLAKALLCNGKAEVCVVWVDQLTGLTCKARIDWFHKQSSRIVDFKTTKDAADFERAIGRYGYHRQMAFYSRGLSQALGICAEPWIICAETGAPYGCRVAPMSLEALDAGNREADRLLEQVRWCTEHEEWPGYENPPSWSCPDWCVPKDDLDLVIGGELLSV